MAFEINESIIHTQFSHLKNFEFPVFTSTSLFFVPTNLGLQINIKILGSKKDTGVFYTGEIYLLSHFWTSWMLQLSFSSRLQSLAPVHLLPYHYLAHLLLARQKKSDPLCQSSHFARSEKTAESEKYKCLKLL